MSNAMPLPVDEPHRLATLHSLGLLDSAPEESFDTLAQCAAQLAGGAIGVISLLDADREWFKAVYGWESLPVREIPRAISFCNHTLLSDGLFEISDATLDARFANNPFVTGTPHLRAYAGAPISVDGVRIGALWVLDQRPRHFNDEQRSGLRRLAGLASELMSTRRRAPPVDDERARLLDFARASGDWMWEADADLHYTWLSAHVEAVTGLSSSSLKGRPIDNSPLLDRWGEALGGGLTVHALLHRHQPIARVITAKTTPRGMLHVSYSAVPVFDAQGHFSGYRGTARDVTALVSAERRAHDQAEQLRKLTSQVPGVIFQLWQRPDGEVHYTFVSDASRSLFGAEPLRSGESGNSNMVRNLLHPDDVPQHMASLIAASKELVPWVREFRIIRNGAVRWIEARAAPERHADGSTLWHGVYSDVTAHKEIELALRSSEERWSLAAEAAGIGIAEIDVDAGVDGGSVRFDARACADHGLKFPQAPYRLADWLASIHPADRAEVQARIERALANGGMLEVRYRLQRPDGSEPTLEMFARGTQDDAGRVTGLVGTCRDVTQQAAHEQLRSDKEAAERASRAKSEFLSRVSHELRTPLNGILGFAQLMAIDRVHPLASDQARRLDSVLRAGRHLLDLINDMLNLARIEQDDFSLQLAPVDLSTTLQTCFSLIQPMADSAGVRLEVPAGRSHWAQADARAVEQVLLNLLSNAIKYNRPAGTVRVDISRSGSRVLVAVSDEGEGLSAAQQAHLFQPFNRLGAEQKRVEGTGLGLVIARELAASMDGELRVQSEPGKGATFTLLLPAGAEQMAVPDGAEPNEPASSNAPAFSSQVLYVEDEPLNVMLMQEVFKSRPQWRLQVATDGSSGLAAVQAQSPDLVLIDMNLPDMNGLDLIRALRKNPATAGLHCIALSADAMQTQIAAALAAGFDDYWTKPINVAHILDGLGKVLAPAAAAAL